MLSVACGAKRTIGTLVCAWWVDMHVVVCAVLGLEKVNPMHGWKMYVPVVCDVMNAIVSGEQVTAMAPSPVWHTHGSLLTWCLVNSTASAWQHLRT